MITVLLLIATAVTAAFCVRAVVRRVAERHTPPELRRDWWPEFERQFRAYTQTQTRVEPSQDVDATRRQSLG